MARFHCSQGRGRAWKPGASCQKKKGLQTWLRLDRRKRVFWIKTNTEGSEGWPGPWVHDLMESGPAPGVWLWPCVWPLWVLLVRMCHVPFLFSDLEEHGSYSGHLELEPQAWVQRDPATPSRPSPTGKGPGAAMVPTTRLGSLPPGLTPSS